MAKRKAKKPTQGSDIDRLMTEKMELAADIKKLKEELRTTRLNARKALKERDELQDKVKTAEKIIKQYEKDAQNREDNKTRKD